MGGRPGAKDAGGGEGRVRLEDGEGGDVDDRPRLLPLHDGGDQLIELPDAEYDSFACNGPAVAPGVCIMLDGNPVTQARLEVAGVTVHTFPGQDLCMKGGGGPTCLTRPIWRT